MSDFMTLSASYIATPLGGNKWLYEWLYESLCVSHWIIHLTNFYRTLIHSGIKQVTVIMSESLHHSINGFAQKHKLINLNKSSDSLKSIITLFLLKHRFLLSGSKTQINSGTKQIIVWLIESFTQLVTLLSNKTEFFSEWNIHSNVIRS